MAEDDEFEKLRQTLNSQESWPAVYMFKFIVPADNKKIALVESKFSEAATLSTHSSSGGKYISITITEVMLSAEAVIEKYKEMRGIEGLMAL